MRIKIVNFEKYNPRFDVKRMSWLRLEQNWWHDDDLVDFSDFAVRIWFILLGHVKTSDGAASLNPKMIARVLIRDVSEIIEAIDEIQGHGKIEIIERDEYPRSDPSGSGRISRIRTDFPDPSDPPLRTDVRDETNETDVAIDANASVQSPSNISGKRLAEIWNANCAPLRPISKLNDQRRAHAKVRLADQPDLAYWEAIVVRMAKSTFCRKGKWATFDWLIKNDSNHIKVAEGNYDDGESTPAAANPHGKNRLITGNSIEEIYPES